MMKKVIKLFKYIPFLITLVICNTLAAQTADTINTLASKALKPENLQVKNGNITLYGVTTNGPDTKNGQWACAKVATIILKEAKVVDTISVGVRHVESALKHWTKINDEDQLKPGDVIVWLNRFTGRDDKKCTGGGNCHVGIVTEKGYFHNSPISNKPRFGGVSLLGFYFKQGYRPPN